MRRNWALQTLAHGGAMAGGQEKLPLEAMDNECPLENPIRAGTPSPLYLWLARYLGLVEAH